MAHPKRKTSKSRRDKRRTHHKVETVAVTTCSNCGSVHRMHTVCGSCGHYRGRQVLEVNA
jgi:large subunit ribosomal protein L32